MPTIKNPDAPASDLQKGAIVKMMAKVTSAEFTEIVVNLGMAGTFTLDGLTKGEASQIIGALGEALDGKVPAKLAAAAKPSLVEMAQSMTAPKPAPVAAPAAKPAGAFMLDKSQAKTILSWAGIADAEVDLEPGEVALIDLLNAFVTAAEPAPQIEAAVKGAAQLAEVPDGHYAVTGEDGTTDFYRVQNGKDLSYKGGKDWTGYVFVDQQLSDDYTPVKSFAVKKVILGKIKADGILEAAKRYGHELGVCGVCHKTLTDPQSIADGIGPVCKAKIGG